MVFLKFKFCHIYACVKSFNDSSISHRQSSHSWQKNSGFPGPNAWLHFPGFVSPSLFQCILPHAHAVQHLPTKFILLSVYKEYSFFPHHLLRQTLLFLNQFKGYFCYKTSPDSLFISYIECLMCFYHSIYDVLLPLHICMLVFLDQTEESCFIDICILRQMVDIYQICENHWVNEFIVEVLMPSFNIDYANTKYISETPCLDHLLP